MTLIGGSGRGPQDTPRDPRVSTTRARRLACRILAPGPTLGASPKRVNGDALDDDIHAVEPVAMRPPHRMFIRRRSKSRQLDDGPCQANSLEACKGVPQPPAMPRPVRCVNSSPEVIRLAVMLSIRYPLSLRQVEDLLFERGILIPLQPNNRLRYDIAATLGSGAWRYIVGTYDRDAGTNNQRLDLNRIRVAQMSDPQPLDLTQTPRYRSYVTGIPGPRNGHIDEFRIAHVQRSDGGIDITRDDMSDPGAFAAGWDRGARPRWRRGSCLIPSSACPASRPAVPGPARPHTARG